jgi:hypothetical protein
MGILKIYSIRGTNMEQQEINYDTTITREDYSEQVDALNEQAGFDFTMGIIDRQMDEYGALYIFLRLNKKHQEDIENSFIALANGNR